jgi:hypothetical protein
MAVVEDMVSIPRSIFDEIVEELEQASADTDSVRRLDIALARIKRMLKDCDPELTPVEHFKAASEELKKGKQ